MGAERWPISELNAKERKERCSGKRVPSGSQVAARGQPVTATFLADISGKEKKPDVGAWILSHPDTLSQENAFPGGGHLLCSHYCS